MVNKRSLACSVVSSGTGTDAVWISPVRAKAVEMKLCSGYCSTEEVPDASQKRLLAMLLPSDP